LVDSFRARARAALVPLALAALLMLALCAFATPARAQQPTRADTAQILLDAAAAIRGDDAGAATNALLRHIARTYGETPAGIAAADMLRGRLAARPERSGRVELLAWGTVYGAWLGIAVPIALGADDPEAVGAGLVIGTPLGFLLAREYTSERSVSAGDARAITLGGTWGSWQGLGWYLYADEGDSHAEDLIASTVLGGIAGIVVGGVLANNADIPAGTATLVNFGALWGTWYGVVGGVLLDAEGDDLLLASLIGGNAGLLGTALVAPGWDMSRNRARLINAGGLIGLAVGGGIDLMIQPDDEKVAILIPAVGGLAGLALGAHLTRDYDRPEGMDDLRQGPGGGALIERDERGAWHIDLPMPAPTLMREGRGADAPLRPALRLDLLHARF